MQRRTAVHYQNFRGARALTQVIDLTDALAGSPCMISMLTTSMVAIYPPMPMKMVGNVLATHLRGAPSGDLTQRRLKGSRILSDCSKILISQRVEFLEDRNETRDSIDQALIRWVATMGFTPVTVSNALGDDLPWLGSLSPAGVVLSGGQDVGTCLPRDETEGALTYARARTLPVLGICRGMQFMVCFDGGDLVPVGGHVGSPIH